MQVVFLFQSAFTATLRESNGAGFAVHTVHIRKTGAIRRPGRENCDERSPASAFSPLFRLFSLLYTTIFFIFAYFKKAEKWLEWICIRYASGNYTLEGVVLVAVLQVCSKN